MVVVLTYQLLTDFESRLMFISVSFERYSVDLVMVTYMYIKFSLI